MGILESSPVQQVVSTSSSSILPLMTTRRLCCQLGRMEKRLPPSLIRTTRTITRTPWLARLLLLTVSREMKLLYMLTLELVGRFPHEPLHSLGWFITETKYGGD